MIGPPDETPDPEDGPAESWDANDPRRQKDQFAPPAQPCECYCLHCGRTFSSEAIWFQRVIGDPNGFEGFWMCPTPNCGGAGFTFDIFPTDPEHPANAGWTWDDDGDEYDEDEPEETEPQEYDPAEPKYQELDEVADATDDIEGDEWKLGLAPGETPPEPEWMSESRRQHEEDEARYNAPDERPRELDWSNRPDREKFSDDDIPF